MDTFAFIFTRITTDTSKKVKMPVEWNHRQKLTWLPPAPGWQGQRVVTKMDKGLPATQVYGGWVKMKYALRIFSQTPK